MRKVYSSNEIDCLGDSNERVPREELWECLRLAETSECYITIIKDMYEGATTTVRSAAVWGLVKNRPLCSVIGDHVTCVA